MFSESAAFYDFIYTRLKDYRGESQRLAELIRARSPAARSVLDVACGTGEHARYLAELGFAVDGVDLEPELVALAKRKNPTGRFVCQDMVELDLGRTYDAVVSLFSAIGYVRTEDRLRAAIAGMARHVTDGGVVAVEPWFEPGGLTDGYVSMQVAEDDETRLCRMSVTAVHDRLSRITFEYLIGREGRIERRSEVHELGLFTQAEMRAAFSAAGLTVAYDAEGLCGRGMYVGGRNAGAR